MNIYSGGGGDIFYVTMITDWGDKNIFQQE